MDFIQISKDLFILLHRELNAIRRDRGLYGLNKDSDQGVKDTHHIDHVAFQLIKEQLANYPVNIYLEGFSPIIVSQAAYNLFIDPVDGSRNWDRGVGDPCFCLAVSENKPHLTFRDLTFAYIGGYHSFDQYYLEDNSAVFESHLLQHKIILGGNNRVQTLNTAHAYLKPGYSAAKYHFDFCLPIYYRVKDIRSIDNSGMDLCEIARGAADFAIEARQLSDFYNLLAYPIFHAAGGVITDLTGQDLIDREFNIDSQYDFIASSNKPLLLEIFDVLHIPHQKDTNS
jgi:fructose-1,6-bisphosphatase/inositol monophosphatase family enzyme